MEVEDTEIIEDKMATTKQSDRREEESTSPKQIAMESVHDRETNVKKVSSPHQSRDDNNKILETPTVAFDSVSLSC